MYIAVYNYFLKSQQKEAKFMQKALIIINPVAGKASYRNGLGEALKILSDAGYVSTVVFTKYAGHCSEIAKMRANDFDLIACMGGDGTLAELVSGLMQLENRPLIGYFPLGTANDIATTLGLPKSNLPSVAKTIRQNRRQKWDVGLINKEKYFTYIMAFGAFTDVSYETKQESKQLLGQLAYFLEGLTRLPKLPHYHAKITIDGRVIEGNYILGAVINSTSVAGVVRMNSRYVNLDDGKFEVGLIKTPSSILELNKLIAEVLAQKYDGKIFEILQGSSFKIEFEEQVPISIDGENGGMYKTIEVQNCKEAIEFLC